MSDTEPDTSVLGKRDRNGKGDAHPAPDGNQDMGPPPVHNDTPEEDSDEDVGPMPMPENEAENGGVKKKRKVDGHLKIWKKQEVGIEFVKQYRAHTAPIVGVSASADGQLFASIAEDGTAKIFDIINFDLFNMIKLGFTPNACCWVHLKGEALGLLAVSEKGSGTIRLYDGRGGDTPMHTITHLHRSPVHLMSYSDRYDCVVSADEAGFVEYWQPLEPFELPRNGPGLWQFKSETDLYEFKKSKSVPTCITLSQDSSSFVSFSLPDRQIRIFNFLSGKMTRKYDESLAAIQEMQQAGTAVYKVEDMEFGRRLAAEKELELPGPDGKIPGAWINAVWDESGFFILYPTLLGIKVVNTVTNRVSRLLGKDETVRWMNLSLYQGAPAKRGFTTLAMAASANPLLAVKGARDPTLFCTGYKRQRFYMFTRNEPDALAAGAREARVLRDYPHHGGRHPHAPVPRAAPKAVENFIGHAKSGYFDGVIFHRVIPKFMIQTGDPLGDGTGGESIWGREFEDEFSDELKHDRPYTVSMANAGPNTNGSQFFITTNATPWLDKKHTIFGRVMSGLETVHAIENVKVNKADKPLEDIKIVNIDIE
ncbi:hypothetical protein EWM64_g5067 [Hericium alpestre]|uniref:peptidylprolyl isomerase n=1 Tax=Hericium alpestre TaxID=135208 RepID=A0A4Y9ZY30_9AGAM|nr:hypothetical protein EWM64_g5067 [Hericium alpestre]